MTCETGEERIIVRNGVVEIKGGELNGVDFQACHITLGPGATLTDCLIDGGCEVTVAK
jgi:hypothetical protein